MKGSPGLLTRVDKEVQAQYVTVNDVRFGPIHAASMPMVVVDLERLEALLGFPIDAIIGLDILANQNFSMSARCSTMPSNIRNYRFAPS